MTGTFYATLGVQYARESHPELPGWAADPDGWIEIEAPDYDSAREYLCREAGAHWAFLYEAAEFCIDDPLRFYPHGCVARIDADRLHRVVSR